MTETSPPLGTAVLVSGQVRSDDNDIQKIVDACEAVNADVFLCLWRKRGTKGFGGGQGLLQLSRIFGNRLALTMPRNWIGANMRKVFPKSDHILPDLGDLDSERYADIFPQAHIEIVEDLDELTIPYMDSNSLRMLYMINRCNALKQAAEAKKGSAYEVVIRHRPDIVLNYGSATTHFQKNGKTIFPKSDDNKPQQLHDIYWVTNSENDNTLTSLYHRANQTRDVGWTGIHHELRDWVAKHELEFEKFPCAVSGINEASYKDRDKLAETANNFADAVHKRQFDVELGGGEDFCAAFDPVFRGVTAEKFPDASEIRQRFAEISELQGRPKLTLFRLQSLGWMVALDKRNLVEERFQFLVMNLCIDRLTRNTDAAKWCAGALPDIFSTPNMVRRIVELVLAAEQIPPEAGFAADYANEICKLTNISKEELSKTVKRVKHDMLSANKNWQWMALGLQSESCPQLNIQLAEEALKAGVYARVLINHAVTAANRTNQPHVVRPLLEMAAETGNNALSYGDLGRFLYAQGKLKAARKALETAQAFEGAPPWIDSLRAKLKDI